ncbi:MAG: YwiC-like family protein [Opitutaceae bacterium]|nr:YwiC-like family protein [Opitutaceae bacterium]
MSTPLQAPTPRRGLRLAALLPREHGSWALVAEPLVLAMLAAPSWRGTALGAAGVALFLMRRPWQVVQGAGNDGRRETAGCALVVLGLFSVASATFAMSGAEMGLLGPGIVAAVAAAVFLWFDRQREARAVLAECAGATTFAAWAVAMVVLAGGDDVLPCALAVGGFAVARALTSILTVRAYVRRRKGQSTPVAFPLIVAAGLFVAALAAAGLLDTWVPAAWLTLFLVRTLWLLGPWAPSWPARRIGWMEAVLGLLACVTTGPSLS